MLLLPKPPCLLCPFTAATILGLKATVALLLLLLIKAKIRIGFFSTLGIVLLMLQTLLFLAAGGAVGVATVGGVGYAMNRRRAATI